MTNRSCGYRSDNELFEKAAGQGLHWRNIRPLVCGFVETKNVYDNASAEIRSILALECSLIFECNVCRNLFRCLANFIKHKRLHCCAQFNHMSGGGINGNGYQDDITGKIKGGKRKNTEDNNDNLSYLILKMLADERKRKIETTGGDSNVDEREQSSELQVRDTLLENQNSCSRVLDNVHASVNDEELVKADEVQVETLESSTKIETDCDSCNRKFESRKSFLMHILKKHRLEKYEFQCPSCSLVFSKPTEVLRHLNSEHKKSIRYINIMRDAIQHQRILTNKKVIKAELTERVQHHEKDTSITEHTEESTENNFSCVNCQKSFQRKAALQTHQSTCLMNSYASDQFKKSDLSTDVFESLPNQSEEPSVDTSKTTTTTTTEQNHAFILPTENLDSLLTQQGRPQESSQPQKKERFPKLMPKYIPCLCKICKKQFNALGNLRRHISMIHYRTRKFTCKLCEYRAFRKYDALNHLGHAHKISGDKEKVSLEYIDEHVEVNVKEGVDDDIILVTDDEKVKSMENLNTTSLNADPSGEIMLRTPEKSVESSSLSTNFVTLPMSPSAPLKRQKFKRSISQQLATPVEHRQKRPKRNRTAPVEKDFVYDLSTILSNNDVNEAEKEPVRTSRRRDTILATRTPSIKTEEIAVLNRSLNHYKADEIKGSAQKAAMLCMREGRAALSSLPQLPLKRLQVRMRQATTTHRADLTSATAAPVIEAPNIKKEPVQTLLDDSYLENITKATLMNFKMKPQLVLPQSTINSLLKKVDRNLQNQMCIKTERRDVVESLPSISVPRGITIKQIDQNYVQQPQVGGGPAFSNYVSINQNQHFGIMQCLVTNNAQQTSDSLLRLALEN